MAEPQTQTQTKSAPKGKTLVTLCKFWKDGTLYGVGDEIFLSPEEAERKKKLGLVKEK